MTTTKESPVKNKKDKNRRNCNKKTVLFLYYFIKVYNIELNNM